ncbi:MULTISPECIES: hypothetical protein [Streptomyces]|uniref:Uncharacterized protein n=1 Tax=Streptomyces dengpaensis TaxID=2049881 RepID=A0ABM6SMD8_9ACTN|nr:MULTISPECIES: hypothetical protein [Streptomyces]AVH55553.1 hypothetical protein C4B68_06925 [Streptomyces dengpaensis]PIB11814.1 hypothetical protein B1C81_00880 [Streptomyces sp. HG99]
MTPAAAILPSRDEPATIAAVTTAVDAALNDPCAIIVHADSSDHPATSDHFTATPTRARKISLTSLPRGKGAQILEALTHLPDTAGPVLIADTDTRNPDPAVYRELLAHGDHGYAIADYPRYWDEANLTSHLARPLIAATTGHDVPQPLAGDLALSARALRAVRTAANRADAQLRPAVDGYGIDAFLLLTAAPTGRLTSVTVLAPKTHAASFPHLPHIYAQAVPVLLALTAGWPHQLAPGASAPPYRPAHRSLDHGRRAAMVAALDAFAPPDPRYDACPWPQAVADAWHSVRNGADPHEAAHGLWPHYVHRVRTWLTSATPPDERAAQLAATHTRLFGVLTTHSTRSRLS